jgi:hypothetical protein
MLLISWIHPRGSETPGMDSPSVGSPVMNSPGMVNLDMASPLNNFLTERIVYFLNTVHCYNILEIY